MEQLFPNYPPEWIPRLTMVKLAYRNLNNVPNSITRIKPLRYLDISHNNLSILPLEIGHIPLRELYINHNKLYQLPPSFAYLIKLKCLVLNHNRFTMIPEIISSLSNLRDLYVYNNELKTLPESIFRLKNLERINIKNNPIKYFPSIICKLSTLRSLGINKRYFKIQIEKSKRPETKVEKPRIQNRCPSLLHFCFIIFTKY